MEEKEYVVGVHKDIDLSAFEAEMTSSTGAGPIPQRGVNIANPRLGSRRMTHFMLTQEEAENLKTDPRVMFVEIPADQNPTLVIGLKGSALGNYTKRNSSDGDNLNWGLKRCTYPTNVYGIGATAPDNAWDYVLDARNVDIVIQDSGIEPTHPEWEDENGNSRFVAIDWYAASGLSGTQSANHYRDVDGHGTHCTGIAAGKTFGWAKGAKIYSQKLEGLEDPSKPNGTDGTGIPIADAFDAIRLWHLSKNGTRPTVVNMSWGYGFTVRDEAFNGANVIGEYRGTPWVYSTYGSRDALWTAVGFTSANEYLFNISTRVPTRVASVDLEIEEMIDAGIHVCIAAGNSFYFMDELGGQDYDNKITVPVYAGTDINDNPVDIIEERYYHRGSSPYSPRAFVVGNVAIGNYLNGSGSLVSALEGIDTPQYSSNFGPGVNIWAPGHFIKSATSNVNNKSSSTNYYADPTYRQVTISGTSMASPQVAGVVALFCQLYKNFTPEQMQDLVFRHSKPEVQKEQDGYNLGNYYGFGEDLVMSLGGGPNRYLYFPYASVGQQSGFTTGSFTMSASLLYE